MANAKISELPTATPDGADLVPIVDVSDTAMGPAGSTRKATVSSLPFDAAGAAAGAVATHEAASDPHPQYTTAAELATALAGYQPLDSDLTAIAALSTTTFGRALLTLADAAAGRAAMGVPAGSGTATGTNTGDQDLSAYATTAAVAAGYQPLDGDLTAIAALATTAFGRGLLALADAAALRTAAGLAAVAATGAYADLSGRPTLGTSAALNAPAAGNAATGEVVRGSDTRLSDARTPTAHTHPAAQISDSTTPGRALLTAADAAAQRAALALSAIARSVYLSSVADGTVVIEAKAAFALTLNQLRGLKTSAGSVSVAVQVNGTNVTGLSGLSATTSAQDATATGANTVAVGDRITLVLSSSASAAGLEFTLSATR